MDTINECGARDFGAILSIVNDAASAYKGVIPSDCWHEPYMSGKQLKADIAAGVRFFVYCEDGRLLGVMGLQEVEDVSLIRHAYVLTARQGRGIGGALLAHLTSLAKRPNILVGTWAAATWALRFYEKHGFGLVTLAEKDRLLRKYWKINELQTEASVVLKMENANRAPPSPTSSLLRSRLR
jgi:GNAT superfamily N-acetyltransferase